VTAIRSPGRTFVSSSVILDRGEKIADGALSLPSLSGSEIELRYTSNGSPLLYEKYRGKCEPRED
jgi:hypothetical protein